MIKRIRFATTSVHVSPERFAPAWRGAVAAVMHAPQAVRPSRVVVCTTLPALTGADPRHDGVGIEWFTDAEHLQRFETWLDTEDGRRLRPPVDEIVDPDASVLLAADECVLRGAEWLDRRWQDGGEKLKHMAVAVRAAGLSPAEFSARWSSRAGRLGRPGAAADTVIPDDARGRAYVQNHPRPRMSGEWTYDAVNEVYFDDVESLRRRIEWLRENLGDRAEEDLVRASWFIAAREEVVSA